MRLSGAIIVPAPPALVRASLTDPEVLRAAIPGCEQFALAGPGVYEFTVTGRVASIEGRYRGQVRLEPEHSPALLTFTVSCAGAGGTIAARVQVDLSADAQGLTQLRYDVDADVGGALAAVGQLMLAETAKRFAADLLTGIDVPQPLPARGGVSARARQWPGAERAVAPVRLPPDGNHAFAFGMVAGAAIAVAAVLAGSRCGRQAS